MTSESTVIRETRFGYGIRFDGPLQPVDLLGQLRHVQPVANMTVDRIRIAVENIELKKRVGSDSAEFKAARKQMNRQVSEDFREVLKRPIASQNGFLERLSAFWRDHFTVSPNALIEQYMLRSYFEDAIRPHIAGPFVTMLIAVVEHPSMIKYLDQNASVGPNSPAGQRRGSGLNENLAREILELHTLGVDGPYSQTDVREFAELLTGLSVGPEGTRFLARRAEPGSEEILGVTYGSTAGLGPIHQFLHDLSIKPTTAQHLATKLVVHFFGADYPADLVEEMARNYLDHDGDLMAFYDVMVNHPFASSKLGQKVKPPMDFIVSAARSVGLPISVIDNLTIRELRAVYINVLQSMGQPLFHPPGPDGWPEQAEAWISPPLLAARLSWAIDFAHNYASQLDPREVLETVLGDQASDTLSFAISGAESKWEGVALMLASPEFNRR